MRAAPCRGAAGRLLALVLVVALLLPLAQVRAAPAASQAAIRREETAIASLDARLAKARAEQTSLQTAQAAGARRLANLVAQGKDLAAQLVGGRQRVDAAVRFLYEDGALSLLDFLLSATSFSDFITRFVFLQRLALGEIGFLRHVAAERQQLQQVTAAAQAEQAQMQARARRLAVLLSNLTTLLAQHRAALADASAALAGLDRTLLDVLPRVAVLLGSFDSLPWSGINPDSVTVDYATQQVTVTVRASTVNAFFAANAPQFAGFSFDFDAGGLVLAGNGIRLAGPLQLAAGQLVWVPDALQVAGQAAPPGTLAQLLSNRQLAITLPVPGGLRPASIATSAGQMQLILAA